MSFQYLIYLKLERLEENVFWHSHIFIIFEALKAYMEQKGRLIFKNWLSDFDDINEEKQEKIAAEMLVWDAVVGLCVQSQISWVLLPHKDYRRGEGEDGRCGGWFRSPYQERDETSWRVVLKKEVWSW